jgi:uncharacterized protein YecT (DUF1311 family)
MTRTLLLFALAALAGPAMAQTKDCRSAITNMDMNICAELDWQEADAVLNSTYQEVMAAMKEMDISLPTELKGAEDALRTAQRAWITYRDAHCAGEGFQMRGGTAETLVVYGCLREMTMERTEKLRSLIDY